MSQKLNRNGFYGSIKQAGVFYLLHIVKLLRKETTLKAMFLVLIFTYLLINYILLGEPIEVIHKGLRSTNLALTERKGTALKSLVDNYENKDIFTQVEGGEHSFYDKTKETIGTRFYWERNHYQNQPYVSNGYIGSRIPNLGQGFSYDQAPKHHDRHNMGNWPLFNHKYAGSFIAGFFDAQATTPGCNYPELQSKGYESILSSVPEWTTLTLKMKRNGREYVLDPSLTPDMRGDVTHYSQNLSISDGIVSTEFVWLGVMYLKFEVLAHRADINLGIVNLKAVNLADEAIDFIVEDSLDFETSNRCSFLDRGVDEEGIYISFSPMNVEYVNAAIYSTLRYDKSVLSAERLEKPYYAGQILRGPIQALGSQQITKMVGIVSSDLDESLLMADSILKKSKSIAMNQMSVDNLLESHGEAWSNIIDPRTSIRFPNEPFLDLASKTSLFHLAANTRLDATGITSALSVCGLSSDCYGGMVFWDSDFWVYRGLLFFLPWHAKSIVNYRIHLHKQALQNSPYGKGAVYPWTSGRFGNCTATGPCIDYEYHINVAIALAAWDLYLSGAIDDNYMRANLYPLVLDISTFLAEYVEYDESLKGFTTRNMTDPDEFANNINNGAYTNAGIAFVMNIIVTLSKHLGKEYDRKFERIHQEMYLPLSNESDVVLEYSGMDSGARIKQADTVMITYPLNNILINSRQATDNVRFYAAKQDKRGPAMTFSMFSIVASKLFTTGCSAHSYLVKSLKPYVRAPYLQYSEQNNDDPLINGGFPPAFPFLTGHGGFLQTVLNGLVGLGFGYELTPTNKIDKILNLDPISLAPVGKELHLDNLIYLNHSLSLDLNSTSCTIRNKGPAKNRRTSNHFIKIKVAERNGRNGIYKLDDFDALTISHFGSAGTYEKSISECALSKIFNISESVPGDITSLINDGDNTTKWQSLHSKGKIMIDFFETKKVTKIFINWGDRPPLTCKISYLDSSKINTKLPSVSEIFGSVNLGYDIRDTFSFAKNPDIPYDEDLLFKKVTEEHVNISEPFDAYEANKIAPVTRFNVTTINLAQPVQSRYFIIETQGVHADGEHGAKIFETVFY